MPPKQKARVGVRLKEAIGGSKSANRSADLDALVEKFNVLRTKLKNLIVSLKSHHAAMQQLAKTRMEVANNIAMLSEKTPVHDSAGLLPSPENTGVVSYRSVHMDFSRRSTAYAEKYHQYIVEYAIEWDKVIYNRVSAGIKEAEKLRRDLDHYQGKVESLRQSTNKTLANGKQVDAKTAEKLSRNEEKLIKAKEFYNRFATDMCILIEEVTERAWKDLHPMLIKLAQFDSTMSSDESKALSQLNQVVTQLKTLADQHSLTPNARLKDLAERKPSEISTAKSGGGLALESGSSSAFGSGIMGGSGGGVTSSVYGDSPSMPPGAVSPQGMGGFPVQVADTNGGSNHISRASSQSSFGSGVNSHTGGYSNYNLTTTDMVAISAASAPPPSMEQVQDATSSMYLGGENRDRTASGSSLPPLGPGYHRQSSNYSIHSVGSDGTGSMGGSIGAPPAPAPAAPPPPPPASNTGLSMYGGYGSSGEIPAAAPVSPAFGTGVYGGSAPAPAHPWSSGGTTGPYGVAPPPASAPPIPMSAPPAPPGRRSSNPFDDDLPEF